VPEGRKVFEMNKEEIEVAIGIMSERQLRIALLAILQGIPIDEAITTALTYPTT
jgi:hypothetical protein